MTIITVEFLPGDKLDVAMRDMIRLSQELHVGVRATFNDLPLLCFPTFDWERMLGYNTEAAALLKQTDKLLREGLT